MTYLTFQNAHFPLAKLNFLTCQLLKNALSWCKSYEDPGCVFCCCELFVELYAYFALPHLLILFQNLKIIVF